MHLQHVVFDEVLWYQINLNKVDQYKLPLGFVLFADTDLHLSD